MGNKGRRSSRFLSLVSHALFLSSPPCSSISVNAAASLSTSLSSSLSVGRLLTHLEADRSPIPSSAFDTEHALSQR
ncbi:hypothetical protein M440DRAFT_1397906 [Trichoderma longibrachiatum ATCC 18648]|uniref:Secreted protein n=1 Tax=Trichoderma longibrachiatum ATCC 18648 TaxID=983965 RepID=A0A2T4CG64_TRILO|nr:hypothetical protein M440DRAFT_1397906 [Trichoderma longibrachiatum ATCC 18648]